MFCIEEPLVNGFTPRPPVCSPCACPRGALHLSIASTKAKNLAPVKRLRKLQYVDIRRTAITDIMPLTGVERLYLLYVDEDSVTDTMRSSLLKAQPSLKVEH